MSLMSMLDQAQEGRLYAAVASSLDLDEALTRKALAKLCPAIAEELHARALTDEALFQSLLDLISDHGAGPPLDDPDALTGPEAIADGNAILDDLFGSRSAALAALRKAAPGVPERELAKLAPISATAVVAALEQANKPLTLAAEALPAAGAAGGQGLISAIVAAIIAGIVSALKRKLTTPARRRTTSYARSRRKTPARRRTANASVEDVFKDILANLGK